MREWRMMLGPFLIWTAHFVLVYAIASVADIRPPTESASWRIGGLVVSAACIAGLILFAATTRSKKELSSLATLIGLCGSALGAVAVARQSLPLLIAGN